MDTLGFSRFAVLNADVASPKSKNKKNANEDLPVKSASNQTKKKPQAQSKVQNVRQVNIYSVKICNIFFVLDTEAISNPSSQTSSGDAEDEAQAGCSNRRGLAKVG